MANNPSAGAYVTEEDRSQSVKAVSSSIGAIVGPSAKGPILEPTLVTNEDEFIRIFGKPNPRQSLMHYSALEFLTRSSRLYVVRVVNNDEARGALPLTAGALFTVDDVNAKVPRPALSVFDAGTTVAKGQYDPFNNFVFPPENQPAAMNQLFMVCAINPGAWNNQIYIEVRPNTKPLVDSEDEFYDDLLAFWVDVWVDYKSPRQAKAESFLVRRAHTLDGFGNQMYIEDVINNQSTLIRVRNNEIAPEIKLTETCHVFLDGGTNGARVSSGQMIAGWKLFNDPEQINVNILIQGGAPPGMSNLQDIADIQRCMTQVAEHRMDAIAVLDIPSAKQTTADAIAYRVGDLNLDSSYAAIYTPDLLVRDKFNDMDLYLPPSGFAASVMALTDEYAEVWFAPAGMERGKLNVSETSHTYNQGHRDALTDAQINAVRFFPNGAGYRIWGADTMQVMLSALSNVSVRRLMNVLEKAINTANVYSVFDPNDDILRSRVRSRVEQYLQPIQNAGGLYWFAVICDETNNPPAVTANGDLVLTAYFDPVMIAKRIKLTANITKTGTTFSASAEDK